VGNVFAAYFEMVHTAFENPFHKKLSLTSHIHKPNEVSAHQILVLFVEDISCADPIFNYYQMQPNGREFNLNPYPKSRGKRD